MVTRPKPLVHVSVLELQAPGAEPTDGFCYWQAICILLSLNIPGFLISETRACEWMLVPGMHIARWEPPLGTPMHRGGAYPGA